MSLMRSVILEKGTGLFNTYSKIWTMAAIVYIMLIWSLFYALKTATHETYSDTFVSKTYEISFCGNASIWSCEIIFFVICVTCGI